MRPARDRSGGGTAVWPSVLIGAVLAIASAVAGAYGGLAATGAPETDEALLAAAVANLERQAEKLAARPGAACPQDFAALESGGPLRISMFYGYDDHEGRAHDRAYALAMAHVLTSRCRGELSACGFGLVSRSPSAARLMRTLGGREVEVTLFTSSLADHAREELSFVSALREQDALSRSVKERFYRELVESDVVFYMGHSRLGGGMGFDRQAGLTTFVNALWRLPMRPVLEALRHRPTRLRILGMFSCDSNRYFRQDFEDANPSLTLILSTSDTRYGPSEQASLGALESILSKNCGYAFHEAMTSFDEPDPTQTYRYPGR